MRTQWFWKKYPWTLPQFCFQWRYSRDLIFTFESCVLFCSQNITWCYKFVLKHLHCRFEEITAIILTLGCGENRRPIAGDCYSSNCPVNTNRLISDFLSFETYPQYCKLNTAEICYLISIQKVKILNEIKNTAVVSNMPTYSNIPHYHQYRFPILFCKNFNLAGKDMPTWKD